MPIESGILLKNHVSCNFMLKYYITVSNRQFTKTLNQFFDLSRAKENLEIFSEYKLAFSLKTAVCKDMIFIGLSTWKTLF